MTETTAAETITQLRYAGLEELIGLLKKQDAQKLDVVAPASQLRARDGQLVVRGSEKVLSEDGVTTVDGQYTPTEVFDEHIAGKLGIPLKFLRTLRADRPWMYDQVINGFLHGKTVVRGGEREVITPGDDRSFLVRLFSDGNGGGVARAMLSDRYGIMENIDGAAALLEGLKDAGIRPEGIQIPVCDLTDRTMRIRVVVPEIRALAPTLLAGYRSPFARGVDRHGNATGLDALAAGLGQDPIVFAGVELRNSEVGAGAYSITPVITVLACTNGATFTKEAVRKIHVGAKMDAGEIRWSVDTVAANIALVRKMTRDAVKTFLNADWLGAKVADLEAKSGAAVEKPAETIEVLGKALAFDAATTAGILDHFIRAGQLTVGGVFNAVTSFAQTVPNAERAMALEDRAVDVLDFLAARA